LLQWKGYEGSAPEWLQKITATKISFLNTIEVLLNYSLIDYNDNDNKTYSMHAVVHDWIRESINEKNDEDLLRIATVTIGLAGGRDSAPVRGVPYEPTAPYGVCRAKFESVEVLWRVVCDRGGVVMDC
jgi:hypothetical protein